MTFRSRLILYALLTSLTSLSIDALLPGLRQIGLEFGVAPPLSTHHVISLFIFGMAFGELLVGPLSDAFGRKPALLGGIGIYLLGTVVALFAQSLEMVLIGRFLQGVGVSGPKIATRAMIRDQFEGDAMARVMSFMFTLFILVPMLAPALAQGLITVTGWRSVFIAYFVTATALGLWLATLHPETLPATRRIPFRPRLLFLNALRILASPRVTLVIIATGLVFGAQLLYLSTAADLFLEAYGVAETFPIYFATLAVAMGLASFINARLVQRVGMVMMARAGFIGLSTVSVFMVVGTLGAGGTLPFAAFLSLLFLAFFAIGILFGNLNALAMQTLGNVAGFGASLIASGSSLVATAFAIGFGGLYGGNTIYLGISFLAAGLSSLVLAEIAIRRNELPVVGVTL